MKKIYKEHKLLDALRKEQELRSDAHLAEVFGFTRQNVHSMRKYGAVPDSFRVAIQRKYGWSIKKIDALAPPAESEKP